jgi:hypothetical protein
MLSYPINNSGSVVAKALNYNPEGHGSGPDEVN